MTTVFRILGSISLLSALALAGCENSANSVQASRGSGAIERPRDTSAVPVTVAKVERSTIPCNYTPLAPVRPSRPSPWSRKLPVSSRSDYKQGQFVHEGDLLLTLDKRPFIAALDQSTAALSRATRRPNSIGRNLSATKGFTKRVLFRRAVEQYRATSTAAEATVNFDEAAIETAKIQLSYCSIYAPISGVTERSLSMRSSSKGQ